MILISIHHQVRQGRRHGRGHRRHGRRRLPAGWQHHYPSSYWSRHWHHCHLHHQLWHKRKFQSIHVQPCDEKVHVCVNLCKFSWIFFSPNKLKTATRLGWQSCLCGVVFAESYFHAGFVITIFVKLSSSSSSSPSSSSSSSTSSMMTIFCRSDDPEKLRWAHIQFPKM